ncbi:MAG: nucleotidyltransferase family protein [Acidimicrobiales bacterium]
MSRVRGLLHENRESIDALVRKHRGISVSVFGSVARGDETENSDIDFLVQFETGSSLFDLLHLQNDLQALLGRSVDVVSVGGLKDRDDQIRREAVSI